MTAIKKFRVAKGMTQEELAAIMGTSQAAVGMWETGARMPRADKCIYRCRSDACTEF